MSTSTQSVASGIAQLALATAIPVAVFGLLLHASRIATVLRAVLARLRPAPAPMPTGRPIELIVADLRRLSRDLATVPAGVPNTRRRGLQAAYDDVLCAACAALSVGHVLPQSAPGWSRELERLRMESALADAGLSI